jgi:hypothetical protein
MYQILQFAALLSAWQLVPIDKDLEVETRNRISFALSLIAIERVGSPV